VGVITFRFNSRTMKRENDVSFHVSHVPLDVHFIEHMHLDRAHSLRPTCLT
jgi:hypothetical protein